MTTIIVPGTKKLPWQPLLPEKLDDKTTRVIRWIWEEIARFLNNMAFKIVDEDDNFCQFVEETEPLVLDCNLVRNGKIFWTIITADHNVQAINGVCGQPLALITVQGAGGGHSLTFDPTMFRFGSDLPVGEVTFSADEGSVDYTGFIRFEYHSRYDIVSHMRGYYTP